MFVHKTSVLLQLGLSWGQVGKGHHSPPSNDSSHVLTVYPDFALLSAALGLPCVDASCSTPR